MAQNDMEVIMYKILRYLFYPILFSAPCKRPTFCIYSYDGHNIWIANMYPLNCYHLIMNQLYQVASATATRLLKIATFSIKK